MTVATTERAKPVPRFFLKVFWAIHRAVFRGTGGRIGLSRPVAGKRFGMLRLLAGHRSRTTAVVVLEPR